MPQGHSIHFIYILRISCIKTSEVSTMNNCTDLYFLSTIACKIADCTPNNSELALLAASLTTLGDMLAVVATRRDV